MDNLALRLIDNMADEQEAFIIDNDDKAEWALSKLTEEKTELNRMVSVCQAMIKKYQGQIESLTGQHESRTGYLREQLRQYFITVPHKSTKTQETYKLPSGTLKLKYQQPEFVRDEVQLLEYLKRKYCDTFVKVKESPDWAAYKELFKTGVLMIEGDKLIDNRSMAEVEGVTVQHREPVFEVEV